MFDQEDPKPKKKKQTPNSRAACLDNRRFLLECLFPRPSPDWGTWKLKFSFWTILYDWNFYPMPIITFLFVCLQRYTLSIHCRSYHKRRGFPAKQRLKLVYFPQSHKVVNHTHQFIQSHVIDSCWSGWSKQVFQSSFVIYWASQVVQW